jgi:hypothetical protein
VEPGPPRSKRLGFDADLSLVSRADSSLKIATNEAVNFPLLQVVDKSLVTPAVIAALREVAAAFTKTADRLEVTRLYERVLQAEADVKAAEVQE